MENKWLIVGTPWVAKEFCATLLKNDQKLAGIFSFDLKTANDWAKKFNIKNVINQLDNIDFKYDYVYIAVPNIFHYQIAKLFLQRDKNILIEKPMTNSLKRTKELFKIADSKNLKIMEAYPHVYPGKLEKYRGKIKTLESNMMFDMYSNGRNAHISQFKKKTWGGAVPDLGSYNLSMAIWLNGPVSSIKIENLEIYKNQVEVTIKYILNHTNESKTISEVSMMKESKNGEPIIADGKIIHKSVSRLLSIGEDRNTRMKDELLLFLSSNYKATRYISLEVARIIDLIKIKVEDKINSSK